jgi:hypothetical protein
MTISGGSVSMSTPERSQKSVRTAPGSTACTRMPRSATSLRSPSLNAST